jgi:hypothetical protein
MTSRPSKPTQEEVDSLAAFIEAAEEFQHEPFCGPDEPLTLGHNGKNYFYKFGDRFHFRSALVSFRRIWLNDEASNFKRILNIICKYENEELCVQMWVPIIRQQHQQVENTPVDPQSDLKNKELVDLWLNAVFAHNNIAQKRQNPKRMDRIDFERYSNELNHADFEYSFRKAVRHFGSCYRNLLNCVAKQILVLWKEKHGLAPSFQIGLPFGRGTEEITEDGATITRKASTQFWNPESPEQKLNRLFSRREFQQLGNVLKRMDVTNLLDIINHTESYEDVLKKCGFQIELVAEIDRKKMFTDMVEDRVLEIIPCHSLPPPDFDSVIYFGKRIVTQQGAIDFFDRKFRHLKELLAQ